MMAASNLDKVFHLNRRWTSESSSNQASYTQTSTGKATAHARSASRSTTGTSSGLSTTTGGSRRSARTTASTKSLSQRSTTRPGGTNTALSSSRTAGTASSTSRNSGPSTIPPNGSETSDSSNSGLTSGARTAIIVATVIGGLLILALLCILLYRWRRKSPKVADAPYLRPPSTTTFLSTKTRDANLTALPMYRERRRQLAEAGKQPSRILPDMKELYRHDPRLQDMWKTANPPTPITDRFPANDAHNSGEAQLRPPQMAQVRGVSPIVRLSSYDATNVNPVESIYAPSAIDLEPGVWPHTPLSEESVRDRWSWSTSYATAKSKAGAQSLSSTIASLPGVRRVREWIASSPNEYRGPALIREGEPGPSRASSVTFLKNKATKPNLAPVSPQQLSGQHSDPDTGVSANPSSSLPANQQKTSDGTLEAVDAALPDDGVIS